MSRRIEAQTVKSILNEPEESEGWREISRFRSVYACQK